MRCIASKIVHQLHAGRTCMPYMHVVYAGACADVPALYVGLYALYVADDALRYLADTSWK